MLSLTETPPSFFYLTEVSVAKPPTPITAASSSTTKTLNRRRQVAKGNGVGGREKLELLKSTERELQKIRRTLVRGRDRCRLGVGYGRWLGGI